LIIGGGIAAYKCLELIRLIRKAGGAVTPVLTRAAEQFVTPLSVASLAGEKAFDQLFDLTDEAEMGHIQLSRVADLVVVAPATADLMAKMAGGHADDLASTLLMATDTPVLIAPAMNVRMWGHAATRRNLAALTADGVGVVGPNDGDMACGEYGPGRMAEPSEIFAAISVRLGDSGRLAGRRVIVTSGPTHEPIDPVRYIANRSSGAQGSPTWFWSPARRPRRCLWDRRSCGSARPARCWQPCKAPCPPMVRCSPPRWRIGGWSVPRTRRSRRMAPAIVRRWR
jgi:phosphopantothenoylcysteine decarboxylase/phosphopantothenate--cysteine ligase